MSSQSSQRVVAKRMAGPHGQHPTASDASGSRSIALPDVAQAEPEVHAEPGFRGPSFTPSACSVPVAAPTSRGIRPSRDVCKAVARMSNDKEFVLPIFHGNDRVEWFVQL